MRTPGKARGFGPSVKSCFTWDEASETFAAPHPGPLSKERGRARGCRAWYPQIGSLSLWERVGVRKSRAPQPLNIPPLLSWDALPVSDLSPRGEKSDAFMRRG